MKSPEEIKKGLEWWNSIGHVLKGCSNECPYWDATFGCGNDYLMDDALAYIQQLERERDAAVKAINDIVNYNGDFCVYCKNHGYCPSPEINDCDDCNLVCECPCNGCTGDGFKWRGAEEEEHAEKD